MESQFETLGPRAVQGCATTAPAIAAAVAGSNVSAKARSRALGRDQSRLSFCNSSSGDSGPTLRYVSESLFSVPLSYSANSSCVPTLPSA